MTTYNKNNQAQKMLDRLIDIRSVVNTEYMRFMFNDNSWLEIAMNLSEPKIGISGAGFAQTAEERITDLKMTVDTVTFMFKDGSKVDIDIGSIPKRVNR